MSYYQELLYYSFKSEKLAQPLYDYLKALKYYDNDVRDLVKKWRKKSPGLTNKEILELYGPHLKKPMAEYYYKKLQDILENT